MLVEPYTNQHHEDLQSRVFQPYQKVASFLLHAITCDHSDLPASFSKGPLRT